MELEFVLVAVAVVLAFSQPIPQIVRLVRSGSIAGVSATTTWLGLVINLAWATYGVARDLPSVAVLSLVYVAGYTAVAALLVRGGNRGGAAMGLGAGAAFAVIALLAGWATLGTVLALVVGAQFVPQVLEAWRSTDLTALAPGTYVVSAIDGVIWGAIGLVSKDAPLVLYGVVMVTVAVLVLIPQRRWARRTARLASAS